MKTRFWNVMIELHKDGTARAAVIRTRKAVSIPKDRYGRNPYWETFSLWYETEEEAQEAVIEARAMGKGQEAAA
jgi:hypothetical protein